MRRTIIGLTGKNGSGKGEAAKFLIEKGYIYFSLSDVLRDELKKKNLEITRDSLIREGQKLRENCGSAVLAERTIKKLSRKGDFVVDSFRHPAEVGAFRKLDNFVLWRIEADPHKRFERCLARARENEAASFEEFIGTERREFNAGDAAKQDLLKTLELADAEIINNGTLEEMYEGIEKEIRSRHSAKT